MNIFDNISSMKLFNKAKIGQIGHMHVYFYISITTYLLINVHNSKLNPLQYKLIGFLASLTIKKSYTFEQASLIVIDLAENVHFTSTGDSNVDFISC